VTSELDFVLDIKKRHIDMFPKLLITIPTDDMKNYIIIGFWKLQLLRKHVDDSIKYINQFPTVEELKEIYGF